MEKQKYVTTKPTSQLDLEQRLDPDHVLDSDIGKSVTVNPNPFGVDGYIGTDPIYQNHANDTETPLAADGGPDELAEEVFEETYATSKKDELVDDYGMGGKAVKANTSGPSVPDVTIGASADVTHKSDK